MRKILIMLFIVLDIFYVFAQKKKSTYFDKATTITATAGSDSILSMLDDYERIQLPPLSVFLESVYDHPSIRIYEAKREEANAEMKITKREWLSYFRVFGQYQYGRVIQLTSRETIDAVSYTHLDVYKRQMMERAHPTIRSSTSVTTCPSGNIRINVSICLRVQKTSLSAYTLLKDCDNCV